MEADLQLVIVIEGKPPGTTFACAPDWTIGKAVRNLREEFVLTGGAIKLNRTSLDVDQTFAEVLESVTGEEISNLQFVGDKIISQGRQGREFIFTFVNGISTPAADASALLAASQESLQTFWRSGLGNLSFARRNPTGSESTYTSSHDTAEFFVKPFELMPNFENNGLGPSIFLVTMKDRKWDSRIVYSNEAEIVSYIRPILRDVLVSLEISQDEVYLSREADLVANKSDIWVVRTKPGVPIAVIEVKQPGSSKISHQRVLGQVFDYLATLRNSFGRCEVFGILTTLQEWRVCWLPDTDSFAAAASCEEPPAVEDPECQFPIGTTLARTLSCSQVYRCDHPDLLRVIGTFFKKSLKSHHRKVPLISSNRGYVILNELDWCWGKYSDADLQRFTSLSLGLPNACQIDAPQLKVLRQFHGGADGQVFLALTRDFQLVVIKKFTEPKKCDKEYELWREVYGVNVLKMKLVNSPSLMMPFVFHCCERDGGHFGFNFDLSSWGKVAGSPTLDDDRFNAWTTKIREFMRTTREISVAEALTEAVMNFSQKCYSHDDLEWRHVALLPLVSDKGEDIVGMKPVLIDLSSVKKVDSQDVAREEMQTRVDFLISSDGRNHDS